MKRTFFLSLVIILLTSCASSPSTATPTFPPPPVETQNVVLEPSDPTQLVTVMAGETFDLVVPSNPSTGYRWDILPELDANLVELVEHNYVAEEPVMPGSGGADVWTFRAVNTGETTVVLGYYPPGNDTDPEETVTFSVRVE